MIAATGKRTVPVLSVGAQSFSLDEMEELNELGNLDEILRGNGSKVVIVRQPSVKSPPIYKKAWDIAAQEPQA